MTSTTPPAPTPPQQRIAGARAQLPPERADALNSALGEFFSFPAGSPRRDALLEPLVATLLHTLGFPRDEAHLTLIAFILGAGSFAELAVQEKPRGSINPYTLGALDKLLGLSPARLALLWAEVAAGGRLCRPPEKDQHYCLVHASTLSQAMAKAKSRWQCGFPACALQAYPTRACPSFALAGRCMPRPAQVPKCTHLHLTLVEGFLLLYPAEHVLATHTPAVAEAFLSVAISNIRAAATRTAAQQSIADLASQRLAANQSTGRIEQLARIMKPPTPAKRPRE